MHLLLHFVQASTTPTTAGKGKSSSSSEYPLLIIVVLFVAAYFFFIRPRSQRMRQQQSTTKQFSVGDPVMSAGGIYGTVVAIDDDVVEVEVSPGVVMTFTRRAISPRPNAAASKVPEPPDEKWDVPSESRDAAANEATTGADEADSDDQGGDQSGGGPSSAPPGSAG